jgi:hypothetical protein
MAVGNGVTNDKNAGFLRGDYLRQLARDIKQLDRKPDCPGTLFDLYYDANITLDTEEDEDAECTDDDMVYVGEEIARFVKELESEYPKYANEFLDTTLCTVPESQVLGYYDVDTIDLSPGNGPPGSGPEENKSEGTHLTVIQNGDQELPPWLAGPGKRHLEKKGLVPTPSMEVLPVPTMAPSLVQDERRLGTPAPTPKKRKRKRKKKRYTFKSSGTCRTCKLDNSDRRRRAAETIDKDQAAENAKEACEFASTASFARQVAKNGAEYCDKMIDEIEDLARNYNDDAVADQFVSGAEVLLAGCKQQAKEAKDAARRASDMCELAKAASQETSVYGKTQEYRDNAEQKSSESVAAAKRVHGLNQEMMGVKIQLKKVIITQNFDKQRKDLEELIEAERRNSALIVEELDEQIDLAEQQLRLAEDDETTAQLEERQAMLEKMKKDKDERIQKMEENLGRMRDELLSALEFQIEEADILLQMEGAANIHEWLIGFGDLLEHKLPPLLVDNHSCLLDEPNVTVTIIEYNSQEQTYNSEECALPWDS